MPVIVTSTTRSAEEMAQTFGIKTAPPPPADTPAEEPKSDAPPEAEPEEPPSDEAKPGEPASVSAPRPGETPPPEEPRHVSRSQQRINELIRERKLAELERDRLAERVKTLEAKPPAPPEPKPTEAEAKPAPAPAAATEGPEDPEPKEEDFTDWQDYQRALARWDGRQEARRLLAEDHARQDAERQRQQREVELVRQAAAYNARVPEAKTRYQDFDTVLNQDLRIDPVMSAVILESDVGPDLAYHLGKHPDEATAIAQMAPDRMLTAMYRLEGRLLAQREARTAPAPTPAPVAPPVQLPGAPPPPPPALPGNSTPLPTTRTARNYQEFKDAQERERAARQRPRS